MYFVQQLLSKKNNPSNESKKYVDMSNRPYIKKLPNLTELNSSIETLRLAAQRIDNIDYLTNLKCLKKLNISFTYIKNLPEMINLEELQMIEVELDNFNDLNKC